MFTQRQLLSMPFFKSSYTNTCFGPLPFMITLLGRPINKKAKPIRLYSDVANKKYLSTSTETDKRRNNTLIEDHTNIQLLEPGLIHISEGLSSKEQKVLASTAYELGETQEKFWTTKSKKEKVLNSTDFRGRIFDAIDNFPDPIKKISLKKFNTIKRIDNSLGYIEPTHLILLYYKTLNKPPAKGYIPWHQDNGENDGDGSCPVISFNIGDSCEFLVTHKRPRVTRHHPVDKPRNLAHRIQLNSGDILVFGNECRYIWHSIYHIKPNTAPEFFPFSSGRLNFTFRYAPSILGKERNYKTIRAEELPRDNPFFKISKMK